MGKIKSPDKKDSKRKVMDLSSPRLKKLGVKNRKKIVKNLRKNSQRLRKSVLSRSRNQSDHLLNRFVEEKLKKIVLKLLGDETIEEIDGFVEEWEYFQDIDLIILGSSHNEYMEYTDLLREEYNSMDLENYNSMRSKVLRTFLTIPFIYSSKLYRDKFEEKARTNLKNEIAELNGK